jgi:hypothetical protein
MAAPYTAIVICVRGVVLVAIVAACGGGGPPKDLASAIASVVPDDARVVGIGELHTRRDGPAVGSALAAFTRALPALGDRISDLVVETWVPQGDCGVAAASTARIEHAVMRPEATKSEVGDLAKTARELGIQPRDMTIACSDYATLAPAGGEPDPAALLTFTTKELARVAVEAVRKPSSARPWVVVYGGALHNDRVPAKGVEEWSYAAAVEAVGTFVEIDVIVPELAEADAASRSQPWFPLVKDRHDIAIFKRGERSYVIVLPRS